MRNPYDNLLVKRALSPAARTATANGITIDRAEDNSMFQDLLFVIESGTVTDGTHTVTVEESDDGTAWSAVAADKLQDTGPAIVAADDDKVWGIGYLGLKRYVRIVVTVAGATTGAIIGAIAVLANPRHAPVTQDN